MSTSELKNLALALPLEERAELAQSLWESLEAYPVSDEFLTELYRRDDEITEGKAICLSHAQMLAEAKQLLG